MIYDLPWPVSSDYHNYISTLLNWPTLRTSSSVQKRTLKRLHDSVFVASLVIIIPVYLLRDLIG